VIRVSVYNAHRNYRRRHRAAAACVRKVLGSEGIRRGEVGVVFHDARASRAMNRRYLRHDAVTDVISFPLEHAGTALEGEIYVNLDRAREQAREYGVSFPQEVARLVIHGALHLAGYDDRTRRERAHMAEREDFFLKNMQGV